MRKICYSLLMCVSVVCLLSSCATKKMTLFSGSESSGGTYGLPDVPGFVLEPGDAVSIVFFGNDKETVTPFNINEADSYMVAPDGFVTLPVIGKKQLAGMTETEAERELQKAVAQQLRNPLVRVRISNAHVTVLGEVRHPGTFSINYPVTLLAALGLAGDMLPNANRENVLIQRQENGKVTQYRVNLLTDELFSSPCYYLRKGDVVYVSPRYKTSRR